MQRRIDPIFETGMKLNLRQIKICIAITLTVIMAGQGIWIYNMYKAHQSQLALAVNVSIENAILREISGRHEQLGGTVFMSLETRGQDTSRYITKTIRSADTSFQVTFDRYDPHSDYKLLQFLFNRDGFPVNLGTLHNVFKQELATRGFPLADTYVEYIDLANSQVLQSSKPDSLEKGGYISSTTMPIDIFHTLAIKGHVHNPIGSIFREMTFQLVLSALLIIICMALLFVVIRTFFWRERIELMRQEAVDAMIHEFKRPISCAVARTALIPYYLQKDQSEKVQQYADNVLVELNKVTAYTDRVQKLSNDSRERILLSKENIVLRAFFEDIVEKYQDSEEKKVDIVLSLLTGREYLEVDMIHFANVIENLIENAIKYSGETVSIRISISDVEDSIAISIRDNGLGISAADQAHIFNKFYRSNSSAVQKRVGFGLGLTYVKALVEAHGGAIKVTSKLGVGTEFILYFPAKNDA